MKIPFCEFAQVTKGYNITKGEEVIPRFVAYHSLSEETLNLIMQKKHPKILLVDKEGWRDGKALFDKM